ncbi:hypothetical protein [Azospirillum sp. INR13]|uniref:hypothetical protein n=1 Tax=Azospirillum sp. INR13 TaxID=2596919 RepID=UPI0018921DFD|nr:hypothetical protein [Azospirillum sp. INR13]
MLTFDDCVALADGDFASTPVLREVGTISALRLIARADVDPGARPFRASGPNRWADGET